jgi:hypothetical protein
MKYGPSLAELGTQGTITVYRSTESPNSQRFYYSNEEEISNIWMEIGNEIHKTFARELILWTK